MTLMNSLTSKTREGWIALTYDEVSEALENGLYYVVEDLGDISLDAAEKICRDFNDYVGEPDVECSCCSEGCTLSAFEYAYMTGCAYSGT